MEQEEILEAVKLILARYIKENRMRNTPERNAILELFYQKGGMHSADEVYDIMAESFRVSRATIYNNVELFYSLGLLIKHEEGTAICTRCGKVTRIQAPNVTYAFNNIKYRRFHPEQIVTAIYGICSSCQSKATRMRKKIEEAEAKKKAMRKKNN